VLLLIRFNEPVEQRKSREWIVALAPPWSYRGRRGGAYLFQESIVENLASGNHLAQVLHSMWYVERGNELRRLFSRARSSRESISTDSRSN
jgi:hypothetical protein